MPTNAELTAELAKLKEQNAQLANQLAQKGFLPKKQYYVPLKKALNKHTRLEKLFHYIQEIHERLKRDAKGIPKMEAEYNRLIAEKDAELIKAYNEARMEDPKSVEFIKDYVKVIERDVNKRTVAHRKFIKEKYNIDIP